MMKDIIKRMRNMNDDEWAEYIIVLSAAVLVIGTIALFIMAYTGKYALK